MNPIIEKIKKLLRMKRGGTPEEIQTALSLAQELASKHGLDISQIDPDERAESSRMTDRDFLIASRIQWESKYAALVLQQFFNVSFFLSNPFGRVTKMTFVGSSWELEIAQHVYRFLVAHFRREWSRRKGRCRNRRAFMYGMYHGLCSKLDQSRNQVAEVGLILLKKGLVERNGYIERNFGEMKSENCTPNDDAHKARLLGLIAGRETNIKPAVSQPARLLLA